MRCTSSRAVVCSFFFGLDPLRERVYSVSSTSTACRSPSDSISASASFAVVTPVKLMPSGLSSARAAALRPLTNSRSTSCSSLMTRIRQASLGIGARQYNGACPSLIPPGSTNFRVLLEGSERVGEPALVAVARVPMQHALGDHAVDDALRLAQHARRRGLVAGRHGLLHVLDRRAHRRAQAHVVHPAHLRLAGALARGLDVCHELNALRRARILT